MIYGFRRWLASISIVALLLSISAFAYAQESGPFPDVAGDHENVTAIQFMKDSSVFEGYPDGTYQPDRVLNRAEQLKVYMLLHGIDPDVDTYKDCFPDVKDEWFAPFVCYAEQQGWVEGYPDGTYKPAQEVNKVEALKMLGAIQGWDMTAPVDPPFDDTPADQWYSKYLAFAKDAGLLMEKSGNFSPAEGLTRASTAELLFRSLAVYALEEVAYSVDLDPEILAVDVAQLPKPPAAGDAPEAEFGDAPESGIAGYAGSYSQVLADFPTLYNTTNSSYGKGAYALDSSMEWLGNPNANNSYSYEVDANDVNDPDLVPNLDNADAFDDGVTGLNIVLTSIPPPATLTVEVTVEDTAPDVPRYLNAVIDLNMDGKWSGSAGGGELEWAVKNYVVNVTPGTTETVTTDAFAYANGNILTPTSWMRVVLSRSPIDASIYGNGGWDGSGTFEYGEVEDYYLQLPDWDDGSGGSGGGAGGPGAGGRGLIWGKPAPVMRCPTKVKFPKDVNQVFFSCGIYNYGGAGDTQYTLWRVNGLVDVLATFGIVTMPTAPPGFFVRGVPGGVMGVMGNPSREWFVGSNRDGTPSTWRYEIIGLDPESTVKDSIIDLGLVSGEVDEGYEAADVFSDFVSWTSEIDVAYLYGDDIVGPVISDVTFFEMDNTSTPGEYRYTAMPHVYHPSMDVSELTYSWSSPVECGSMGQDGNLLNWTFPEADMNECLYNGLSLTVSDGTNSVTEEFFDVFADTLGLEAPPVNQAPAISALDAVWTNTLPDDPHIYTLTVEASDPEGQPLSYDWMNVTCGQFTGGTTLSSVTWEYALADMGQCASAVVTVKVSDGELSDTQVLPIFP